MAVGCAGSTKTTRYSPSETLLEILNDFQRHRTDDTYRFHAARDITGRNLYKVTLIRLSNYEKIHPNRFRDIIKFNKAKAYERLRAYDLAIRYYQDVLARNSPLAEEARKALVICRDFRGLSRPIRGDGSLVSFLWALEKRMQDWEDRIKENQDSVYEYLAREEQERVESAKMRWIEENRKAWDNGTELAIEGYQELVSRHAQSKNVHRYVLRFADFYNELAHEYAEEQDPAGLDFDLEKFEKLVDAALELYSSVASKDGILEKLEAKGRQEALFGYIDSIRKLSQ